MPKHNFILSLEKILKTLDAHNIELAHLEN